MTFKIVGFIVVALVLCMKLVEKKYFEENRKQQEEFRKRADNCIKTMEKNTERIIKEEEGKLEN